MAIGRRLDGRGDTVASFLRHRTHHDVVVHPTQRLLKPPFTLFQGGPDWPWFWLRRSARHCWFTPPVPLDVRPRPAPSPIARFESQGVWCGPLTRHFGHAVTTFGGRIAAASLMPSYVPLVFSGASGEEPPAFLWQILAHFGVAPIRVRIVTEPTLFGTLCVMPQAERPLGGAPGEAYLDLLDELCGPAPPRDGGRVYVSRAGLWKGKIAGESYIEAALGACGYQAFRPEDHPLDEQLATYRRASHLVFAEGSAMHALQLLGAIDAEVTVIVRRKGVRLARAALSSRVPSLSYVDAARGLLRGVGGTGWPQPSAGMTIIDTARLVARLGERNIPIGAHWDQSTFQRHQSHDLNIWLAARARHPTHARDANAISRSLRSAGLRLDRSAH